MKKIVCVFLLIALAMPLWGWAQDAAKEPAAAAQAELDRLHEEAKQACYAADYQTALQKWQVGLEQARALNDKRYISQFLTGIGVVYWSLGQYQEALTYSKQALVIAREIGDRRREGVDLGNLGLVYENLGQYQEALKYYEQALVHCP